MSRQNIVKLLLDLSTFTVFTILMEPRSSGVAVHEWLAVSLGATIIVHLLLNWNWVAQMTVRVFRGGLNGSAVNYILNWLLFLDGIVIMLSGLMISRVVAPTLGLNLPSGFEWRGLHSLSTNAALVILGVHVALHWNWIVSTVKRTIGIDAARPAVQSFGRKDLQA